MEQPKQHMHYWEIKSCWDTSWKKNSLETNWATFSNVGNQLTVRAGFWKLPNFNKYNHQFDGPKQRHRLGSEDTMAIEVLKAEGFLLTSFLYLLHSSETFSLLMTMNNVLSNDALTTLLPEPFMTITSSNKFTTRIHSLSFFELRWFSVHACLSSCSICWKNAFFNLKQKWSVN